MLNELMVISSRTMDQSTIALSLEVLEKAVRSEHAILACLAVDLAPMLRLCLAANFADHQLATARVIGTLAKCVNQRSALLKEPLQLDLLIQQLLDEEVGSDAQVQRALFDAAAALALEKRKLSRMSTEVNL